MSVHAKNLDTLYDVLEHSVQEEIRCIKGGVEQLDILMALRRASVNPAESRRKKRKTEETDLPDVSDAPSKISEPRKSRSATAARLMEENSRLSGLQSQLPLQRGRRVAFCQPPRDEQGGAEEEWILATVVSTIQGDKYRYVVQDAEDESSGGPTWNTTIDSIVPLPTSADTLPSEDYVVGTRVLALYPDTSCFYWATVQGGGPNAQAHSLRSKVDVKQVPAESSACGKLDVPHCVDAESMAYTANETILVDTNIEHQYRMDKNPNDNATAGGAPSQMTWQQQMMSQSWSQAPRKKKEKTEVPSKKKDKPKSPTAEKASSHMTWQQELFQQSKRAGPTFDHAADARDVQTFGGETARTKASQPGAAGTPERRKNGKAKGGNKNARGPNTPKKEQGSAPVAYAGPTFHNSPSAASLPTPKFASRGAKSPLSEPASTGPSSAMTPLRDLTVPSPPPLQTVDHLLAQMLKSSSVSDAPAKTSSLQVLDDSGSATLVRNDAQGAGRLAWYVPARIKTRPALDAVTRAQHWIPNTGRHPIPFLLETPVHERALHALSFLRRYHTSVDVPSHVLAEAILSDEQTELRQADEAHMHTGPTTVVLPGLDGDAWLVCVGGENRSDIYISTIRRDGPDILCIAAGRPALQTTAPILQVARSHTDAHILVRTWTTTMLACIAPLARDDTGPRFAVRVLAQVHTGAAVPTRQVDVLAMPDSQVCLVDAHGTLRTWDAAAQKLRECMQLPKDDADHVWMLAANRGPGIWAASCSNLMSMDLRASAPAVVASTSHSVEALRRAKITSLCAPTLSYDAPLVAIATTDVVEYYDARYPSVPLHTWTHRRGFDRTLSLASLGTAEHAMLCLSSQRNRLRTLYDVRQEKTHLDFAMPSVLHAPSLLVHEPTSPAPPCFADMTALPGWADWAPAHHGRVLQLEQTMRGALYAQWLGPVCDEDRESHSAARVQWSLQAQQNEKEACGTHDAGPFGELETTHVDFRALYKATILGSLGTDTLDTLERVLPERLKALHAAPPELAHAPHTLLDRMHRSAQDPDRAGSSHLHTGAAAHGPTLLASEASRDALERVWAAYPTAHLAPMVDAAAPCATRDVLLWLQQRHSAVPAALAEARMQEAVDVTLATTWVSGPSRSDVPEPQNGNWLWDRVSEPEAPEPVPLAQPAGAELSETAKMLLMEWPLGAPTSTYKYENPYCGLDLPQTHRPAAAAPLAPSASQPARPAVIRSRRASRPVDERPSASQAREDRTSASQAPSSQDVPMPQTQLEPGRFAQAPRAPAKKKKRLGGF
ncbi:hypothetical protein MCAP1_001046 [Malassezia caprae]|uniref:SGF29 C-terminal domain-containing protein n=1 Tax=Malassezia caprae TaxID=1381934 RepID=A0AAF0IZA9_9BASI|nr:hypothetical protein MCAP1_001046 [Malassezia caprae]